ncbi:MAG: hypothetical protein JXA11_00660 [Phycisphaerae bacterium]|nr:hypothetical protein [Phycisphaerae bacterium]
MTPENDIPEAEPAEYHDEPLIDDEKPMSRRLRYLLVLLAVGMFVGGIVWNYQKARQLKERQQGNSPEAPTNPRSLEPPPAEAYPWMKHYDAANSIHNRIPPPPGTFRVDVPPDSFAHWLRYLPVKAGQQKVMLHTGKPKRNQRAHWMVLDIDTGPEDLQGGPEAILRLRAEYLFARNEFKAIQFHISAEEVLSWYRWRAGDRPVSVKGEKVTWNRVATTCDDSYANFRAYLNAVFKFADTNTLMKDIKSVPDAKNMRIGDVFLHPGNPGHAVIVVDMVRDPKSGDLGFLLAQSFIPAQDMHILANAYDPEGLPWYRTNFGEKLQTPEWTFQAGELRRFP